MNLVWKKLLHLMVVVLAVTGLWPEMRQLRTLDAPPLEVTTD
jgi:hypothetical protein